MSIQDGAFGANAEELRRQKEMRSILGGSTKMRFINELKIDPGAHYRKELLINISQEDLDRGHVIVKLDPARIAQVYSGMSGMRFTILKKVLRCGTGGKTYIEDLQDIISAAQREIEILKEDGEA